MPLVIKSKSIKALIESVKRDNKVLEEYDQNKVDWDNMHPNELLKNKVNRNLVLKILEEVMKRKTTNIKVEQLPLFK